MITAKEIRTFSEKLEVPTATIDKDWALGHLLAGIFVDPFENFRFPVLREGFFQNLPAFFSEVCCFEMIARDR